MIEVKSLGLETCMTLGMLTQSQADRLNNAGLIITIITWILKDFYDQIITTRTYEDRLNTLQFVRNSGYENLFWWYTRLRRATKG